MTRRTLIVLTAYALSMVYGLPTMLMGAMTMLFNDPFGATTFAPFVWLGAWVCHGKMSVAWIRDRRLSRRWPAWGTAAGVFSLFSPLLVLFGPPPPSYLHTLGSALFTSGMTALFLSPCILLAVWLVRYHWSPEAS